MSKSMAFILSPKTRYISAIIVTAVALAMLPGCQSFFGGTEAVSEATPPQLTATGQPPTAAVATTIRAVSATTSVVSAVTPDEPSPAASAQTQTPTPPPTETPAATVITKTAKTTLTPVRGGVTPSSTEPNGFTNPTSAPQAESLLPAPTPLEPADGMVFSDLVDASQIVLRWDALKPTLGSDELYLIEISYNYQGQIYTDYAWTQQPSWSMGEHSYLSYLSEDGLFIWSVRLIRQTGTSTDGVPQGPALSRSSPEQSLVWQTPILDDGSGGSSDNDDDDDDDDDNGGGGYP